MIQAHLLSPSMTFSHHSHTTLLSRSSQEEELLLSDNEHF